MRRRPFAALVAALALAAVAASAPARAATLLVLEFELNDLTLYPNVEQEQARVASLRPLLVEALAPIESVALVEPTADAAIEAARGHGYLFDRPRVAAELARASGADWALTGRLHKASHLFVYLKAQLVDARDGRVAADFAVEIKGWGEKLTQKGVESLAVQLVDALDTLEGDS